MPELPEVETVCRGLKKEILNHKIVLINSNYKKIVKNNFVSFQKELTNNTIEKVVRHGKYIFLLLKTNEMVLVHLRMTGQLFLVDTVEQVDKHTHLEIYFENLKYKLIYRDIRKFGGFELVDNQDIQNYIKLKKLGPDALKITTEEFNDKLAKKTTNIKATILDQHVIAGIGNIYADEVLIREKLSPKLASNKLSPTQRTSLLKTIKAVLKQAILKKGTSFSDYVNTYGEKGKFQLELKAYQKTGKPCMHCGTAIIREKIVGRGTHFCPKCQKS